MSVPCPSSGRSDGLYSVLVFPGLGGSHSGLVRPPAKRVGAVEASRGFESLPLRQHHLRQRHARAWSRTYRATSAWVAHQIPEWLVM
jgi:hypothetical protein